MTDGNRNKNAFDEERFSDLASGARLYPIIGRLRLLPMRVASNPTYK